MITGPTGQPLDFREIVHMDAERRKPPRQREISLVFYCRYRTPEPPLVIVKTICLD